LHDTIAVEKGIIIGIWHEWELELEGARAVRDLHAGDVNGGKVHRPAS
jgi:hypothetical protein